MPLREVVLGWLVVASVVGFGLMVWDKAQAQRRSARIPERVLLSAAMVGGTPGVILAMVLARHKTRKPPFLLAVALIVTGQVGVGVLVLQEI